MSRKKGKRMNDEVKEVLDIVDRKVIGQNPDGTPIYEKTEVVATEKKVGEEPAQ